MPITLYSSVVQLVERTAVSVSSIIKKFIMKNFANAEKELKDAYEDNYEEVKHKLYIAFDNEEETQKDINKIVEIRNEDNEELQFMIEKVRVMLALAENYEQKIDILKNYGILNEDGIF